MAPKHLLGIAAAVIALNTNAVASADQEVVTVVLNHFASRNDASIGNEGLILLRSKTQKWTDELMRGFSLHRGNDVCPITDELYDQLIERNPSEAPVSALVGTSEKWRVATTSETKPGPFGFSYKADSGAHVRTLAGVARPAFSAKGDTAFLMFFYKWSMHSAIAQYIVERSPAGWNVKCSQLRFYP